MEYKVAHFLRKYSQLKASFIINQVENHIQFSPVIIYKLASHKKAGGFAEVDNLKYPHVPLTDPDNLLKKLEFSLTKLITKKDVEIINIFLHAQNADILHFHYGTCAGIFLPFTKNNKIPSVVSFYGYDSSGFPNYFGGYGKQYLKKRVFPYIDKILAMSPDMKNDLISIGCPVDKIVVHHHGNDVQKFYLNRNYLPSGKTIKFLIISGLTPQKGHLFLLKSFKDACKTNMDISLTIVGDGIERKKINKYIKENNLSGKVDFKKSVVYGSSAHLEYLQSHDIFIHPSITDVNGDKEGIPGAIIEAMASGLPVISTYHAGIPYIIENNKSGILVNEFDYKALTQSILELAGNPDLREKYGKQGQLFAMNELSIQHREEELEKIYIELIKSKKRK
jgi:colanic acid/amylovoran biosynthesis glycosyltransferase